MFQRRTCFLFYNSYSWTSTCVSVWQYGTYLRDDWLPRKVQKMCLHHKNNYSCVISQSQFLNNLYILFFKIMMKDKILYMRISIFFNIWSSARVMSKTADKLIDNHIISWQCCYCTGWSTVGWVRQTHLTHTLQAYKKRLMLTRVLKDSENILIWFSKNGKYTKRKCIRRVTIELQRRIITFCVRCQKMKIR